VISSGDNDRPSSSSTTAGTDRKEQPIGTSSTTTISDKTVTTVTVNDATLEKMLDSKGGNATIAIPVNTGADVVVIATPTNYDDMKCSFDTSTIESVLHDITKYSPNAIVVIRSTVPVGYTENVSRKYDISNMLFCP
jgi:UDP-glucose 6-dehydrogenase